MAPSAAPRPHRLGSTEGRPTPTLGYSTSLALKLSFTTPSNSYASTLRTSGCSTFFFSSSSSQRSRSTPVRVCHSPRRKSRTTGRASSCSRGQAAAAEDSASQRPSSPCSTRSARRLVAPRAALLRLSTRPSRRMCISHLAIRQSFVKLRGLSCATLLRMSHTTPRPSSRVLRSESRSAGLRKTRARSTWGGCGSSAPRASRCCARCLRSSSWRAPPASRAQER
mmetsp:Transcript_56389/g.167490  ORF Transcript_56389/g.167490 Transcript_56389/m.167490 type:complete len:224 (+) Transcript_56389:147-818(+)